MHENVRKDCLTLMRKYSSLEEFVRSFGQVKELPSSDELARLVNSKVKIPNFIGLSNLASNLGFIIQDEPNFREEDGYIRNYLGEFFGVVYLSSKSRLRGYILAHELGHIIAPSLAVVNNLSYFSSKISMSSRDKDEERYLHHFAAKLTNTSLENLPADFIDNYFREL
ncbi:MAG: hypothetical protein Q7R87_05125 [Nanoarchaeota archaeon]|nr:hypothetical protein [Nanoarchaeota archaeon]